MVAARLNRVTVLVALAALLIIIFLAANDLLQNLRTLTVYIGFAVFIAVIYGLGLFKNLPAFGAVTVKAVLPGLILGGAFVALNSFSRDFSIGFPLSLAGNVLLVSVPIPILEEIAFRGGLQRMLEGVTKNWVIAMLIQAGIFAAFHFAAYGSSLQAVTTPFIGAVIFAIGATLIMRFTGNTMMSLIAPTIAHIIFNFWLVRNFTLAVGI